MTAIDPPYRFNSRPANNRNRRILLAPAEVGYLNGHRPFNLGGGNGSKCPETALGARIEQRRDGGSGRGHRAAAGLLRGNLIEYFVLAPQRTNYPQ